MNLGSELVFSDEISAKEYLIDILSGHFELYCEVNVQHATFGELTIRPDIVAIPLDQQYNDIALAFEIKSGKGFGTPEFAKAFKQASDYVLSRIKPDAARCEKFKSHVGKPIVACFMFPAPPWATENSLSEDMSQCELIKTGDEIFNSGMAHMAGYLRVGMVRRSFDNRSNPFVLCFGPNEVWNSSKGWRSDARNKLVGKRQIGSVKRDISKLLKL
ncbi:MAG: hypothetical protein OQJ97_14295 [Rhodospirillales bacterium]|nr:hypothetical protein [Rhodospirillales bacterium]